MAPKAPTERAALLVIDMQNGFCREGGSCDQLFDIAQCRAAVTPCVRLVRAARTIGLPIIFTRIAWRPDYQDGGVLTDELLPALAEIQCCADGTWDAELIDELRPQPQEFVVTKNRFSAFYGTRLASILTSLDVRHLVVCGVTTNICVETTVRDAAQRDYRVFVARDATGEIEPERHEWALTTIDTRFGWVVDSGDVLAAWGIDVTDAA